MPDPKMERRGSPAVPEEAPSASADAPPPESDVLTSASRLGSDLRAGLPDGEVEPRRERFGPNLIPEERPNPLLAFLRKFWGLSAWMIELIVILSIVLHRPAEAWVSAGLLALNALIGFLQDRRASRAVEVLKSKLQVGARVLRNRTWSVLPADQLVPGDVIRLRIGDFIPADSQVAEGELRVDQSALTGES